MKQLSCPSCGSHLELPDNLEVAHCMYCGVKILLQVNILLQIDEIPKERINLNRYRELSKTALDAKNYEDALQYCNKILEIDPKDVDAWIDKATSTFWLTTSDDNRYNEAIEYLNKAALIAPEDPRIDEVKKNLTHSQALWLNKLGNDSYKNANKLFGIWVSDQFAYIDDARKESKDTYVKAMNYYLAASSYAPEDMTILSNIAGCAKTAHWIKWSNSVEDKIEELEILQAEMATQERIIYLKEELQEAQEKLSKLKSTPSFISGMKIGYTESRIRKLQAEIAELEETTAISV